ncbi:hypothetical protein [Hymenobacter sp. BT491]|uniref:hypothetical protein n=1 Tax=Hymenobacter sp. BT491 TaxID=2766779 RepID=UPI001653DD3C|nr:hypothetical protein [Hymenobacter sp. BT491]MBC6989740.1 hypothetical protein [Hymenobacter sp. BT491]
MKKLLLVVLLLASVGASAQMKPVERKRYLRPKKDENCAYVFNVTKNTDEDSEADGAVTRLAYRPYAELLAEIDALRKMNNWADSTYQRRFSTLPAGGTLVITMLRRGAQNADPAYLALSAKDKDGKVLLAQESLPAGSGRFWNRDLYTSQRTIPFVKTETPQEVSIVINDAKLKQDFMYLVKTQ